ncbi:histone-lysine N-methyltransferase SMYD3 isoform X2 [Betta splendens]|uniref:[histone H3]-lysine(4) N-trimethyltransferase n=1 Tax=Betta splendens TaxID=158456 RepID=A0A9W2XNS7_BETSP|nr:histone-lysine N-methyltransferase SMYD3 isoform X2 [Betta splendens]
MAPKLERVVSPGKGNGLRAAVRLRRGELVYSAEPLACCVSSKLCEDVCHHCFTRQEKLLRCSQCKTARYCNASCQLSPSKGRSEELYTLEEHESHLSSMSEQKKQGLSQLAAMLEVYLQQEAEGRASLPSSCRDPLSLIAKVTCNCFTISDGELQEVGVGLYPSLSLLNHDCRPNCVMVFEGTTLHLRAVREINPEEELTISYIGTLLLTDERRVQLEEQYHFTCLCQRCESKDDDALMLAGDEAAWIKLKEALPGLEALKAECDWRSLSERCCRLLSAVGGDVPDENLYKLRMTDMALDACIHLGDWEEALRYGRTTLPAYRRYFPDPHPVHGVQLMRVGKLQHYLEHTQDALDTFKQAYQILKLTHGGDHPLTTDLLMKLEECRCVTDE